MKKKLLLILLSISFTDVFAITRYVKPTATGTGDGSTWANASADLQAMIVASSSGDEVWVMAGLYKPLKDGSGNVAPSNVQNKVFWLKSGVKLYGGFAGTETLISQRVISTNKTILSGDIDNNDTNTDGNNIAELNSHIQGTNVYQVLVLVNCDKTTVVDGLIMTAAAGSLTTGSPPGQTINGQTVFPYFGSAMNMSSSYPTIKNCVFAGNGGTYGAIYHNNNVSGTYIDSVRVINSVFTGNNCQISGGMYMHRGHSYLNNVLMFNNSSSSGSGGFTVSNNMANSGQIVVVNSTFVNNYGSSSSKSISITGGTAKLYNSIIYNSTPYSGGSALIVSPGTLVSAYSLLQNSKNSGVWNNSYGTDGGNNIDLNPNFSNISSPIGVDGNYFTSDDGLTLTNCSPAINTGTNTIPSNASVLSTDILGNTRPFSGSLIDMGAYEFQATSAVPSDPTNVSVDNTSIICGQTVVLSATCATGTVTWYSVLGGGTSVGTGNGLSISPLTSPTTYYASCETSATCISINRIATNSISVALPADPTSVSASNTAICPSTPISLSAICTAPATPEWYNGASTLGSGTSFNVSPTSTTTYTTKCKNGSCLSPNTGSVTVNVLTTPTNISPNNSYVCAGQQVTYSATCLVGNVQWHDAISGGTLLGTGTSYTFSPNHASANFYRIYPSCTNGSCTSNRGVGSSYYFYPAPTNVAVSQTSLCQGQGTSINLSATCSGTNVSVRWYDSATGGTLLGTTSPLVLTPIQTTTYYAECYNSNNPTCSTTRVATQQVVMGVSVTAPTNVFADKSVVCPNTSISLSATCATGIVTWYNQATGGSALGTGSPLTQSLSSSTTYYATCISGSCTPSSRVATSQVIVATVGSNLNLTTNISGTSIQASSNTIVATNSILTGANVKYLANNSITLNPQSGGGFHVANGAVFEAKILPLVGCN